MTDQILEREEVTQVFREGRSHRLYCIRGLIGEKTHTGMKSQFFIIIVKEASMADSTWEGKGKSQTPHIFVCQNKGEEIPVGCRRGNQSREEVMLIHESE